MLASFTVHRQLSRHGLMAKSEEPTSRDRRRFAFEDPNELWMSDVMHGPTTCSLTTPSWPPPLTASHPSPKREVDTLTVGAAVRLG